MSPFTFDKVTVFDSDAGSRRDREFARLRAVCGRVQPRHRTLLVRLARVRAGAHAGGHLPAATPPLR